MSARSVLVAVSLLLSVAIGLVVARDGRGAAPAAGERARPLLGLSMDTLKEARWQADRDMFVARAEALGADVLVQSANSDDAVQIADVQALISRGVDVLVIIPHDGDAMAEAVRLAHAAEVPVVAYDRLIKNAALDLYLSFDNERVGELQARYLVDTLSPRPGSPVRIVRIYGSPNDHNARLVKDGQDRLIAPLVASGAVEVVFEDWADEWRPENAKRIVNAAITRHGRDGFTAVLASNDGTAGGAIQALLEEGLAGAVLVTGQDADRVACQRIARGTQAMTIYKPLRRLAQGAAEVAVLFARGKPVIATASLPNGAIDVPSVLYDVVTVTRENLAESVVADGFHSHEEVFGAPAP